MRKYIIKHLKQFPAHLGHQIQHAIDCKIHHIPLKKDKQLSHDTTLIVRCRAFTGVKMRKKVLQSIKYRGGKHFIYSCVTDDIGPGMASITSPSPGQQTVS